MIFPSPILLAAEVPLLGVTVGSVLIVATAGTNPKAAFSGAVPFLKLMGIVCGGWQMARAALVAEKKLAEGAGDAAFYKTKITTARFYADHVLSQAISLSYAVVNGAEATTAIADEQF